MRHLFRALAVAAALGAVPLSAAWGESSVSAPAPPVLAPAAPSWIATPHPTAEAELLGQEMVHALFSQVDFGALIRKEMQGEVDRMFDDLPGRPRWRDFMRESMLEEADVMKPTMERLLGEAFAKYFTLDELRAGVGFMRGPAGGELAQLVADGAAKRTSKPLSKIAMREMAKLARQPAGRTWAEKFGNIETVLDGVTADVTAVLILDLLRRFLDKASAAETALHASP